MPLNGLTRSRRSHFSRKDSTPEGGKMNDAKELSARIVHEYDRLMFYSKSPHSWALPKGTEIDFLKFVLLLENE